MKTNVPGTSSLFILYVGYEYEFCFYGDVSEMFARLNESFLLCNQWRQESNKPFRIGVVHTHIVLINIKVSSFKSNTTVYEEENGTYFDISLALLKT